MKLNHTDVLKIIWGDGTKTARPANGWDGNVSKYFDVNWYDFTAKSTGARVMIKRTTANTAVRNLIGRIKWNERDIV